MKLSNLLIIVFVLLGLVGFFIVASRFGEGEKGVTSQKPITTCQGNRCFYTSHPHFHLKLNVAGKQQDLPFEKGNLQKSHTHAEKNTIHWHATLPVDPNNKQVIDWSPLKLAVVLDEIAIIYQGKSVKVMVSGQEKREGLDYVWQDGDDVEITIQ